MGKLFFRSLIGLTFGVLLLGSSGCGGSGGTLSGKIEAVNHKSKKKEPLIAGRVILVNMEKNLRAEGTIKPDGTYEVQNVLPGSYKIVVMPTLAPAKKKKDNPDEALVEGQEEPQLPADVDPKKLFRIHQQYIAVDRTPLQVEVQGGTQNHDLSLDVPWKYEPPSTLEVDPSIDTTR